MKKILACVFAAISLQADMVMDVISEQTTLPGLKILAAGEIDEKFDKVLRSDIFVGAQFDMDKENPEYTLTYTLKSKDKNLSLNLVLLDNNGAKRYEKDFTQPAAKKVFLSHGAISHMHKELGLADLDWMNKKLLITRKVAAKQSQILEADYTLEYQKILKQGGLNLFAKWANDEQNAYFFTDYNNDNLFLYKQNILNDAKELIATGTGMLAISDIMANQALMTKTFSDQPEIVLLDLSSKTQKRLTNYGGIDVSAKFLGDDSFVFVSDRGGYPNLFAQNFASNSASMLVYHGKNNSSFGVWRDYLVYSSREKSGDFNLYLLNQKSQMIRQLTLNGKNTFPTFSSDGKTILFIKYLGAQSSVGILRLDENKAFFFPLRIGRISTLDW